ncbi:MAG TPA: glycoside hydrolase family 88 protein, partial [Thermoanaerobaculia bacterium]
GSAYVTNSRFFGRNLTASIWHDGSRDESHKFVIRNSDFDGLPNFPLGRNHRDAQFYLLDARFSRNMVDRPIYPSPAPDPRQWGERYYYANAHRDGGDYAWHADNLETAAGSPRDEDITAQWTFGGRWDPASLPAILPFAAIPRPEHGWKYVDPTGATLRWTPGRNATAQRVHFGTLNPPPFVREQNGTSYAVDSLEPGRTYYWRIDSVTPAGVIAGKVWSFRADPRTTRIALVGDSTVTEKSGWGLGFKAHVHQNAAVLNLARGGRSSKSYINEGSWADALQHKPTHVLIQFGHNDQPGKGLDRETDLPTFRANLARYVDDARAIGAKPVLVTSLTRRNFRESDLAQWADATKEVAAQKNVPLIDLHAKSIAVLEELGPPVSPALGPLKTDGTLDKTHLNAAGSALFGAIVAEELPHAMPELASYIRKPLKKKPIAPWSVRMVESELKRTPDPLMLDANPNPRWEYTPGLVLKAIQHVHERTGDPRYWDYILGYYDKMIAADGSIGGGYKLEDYNIDRINPGKPLFALYEKTKNEKYRKAIETLREQMRHHPRVSQGGFWHKKRYPHQMWLDGLYMGAPFLAQYAKTFHEPALFNDVVNQYVLMEKVVRDEKTGLLYHGWDESRQQKWADPQTGRSPAFWGRAMGWYAMGLVETLDYLPPDHPRRGELVAILQRLAEAIVKVQDPKTGVWWQVLDQGGREGNYLESSVSTMFAFALLKGTRLRYLDPSYEKIARRAYDGVIKQFISVDKDGLVDINQVCQVAGLGGDPEKGERYRSGTYEYYVTEKIRSNDPKGVGPFIFAALEMERR